MAEKVDGEPAAADQGDPAAGGEEAPAAGAGAAAGRTAAAAAAATAGKVLPFPGYVATAFYRLHQTSLPRRWCLTMITWPYPFYTGTFSSITPAVTS